MESEKQLLLCRNRTAKTTSVISVFGIIKMCSSERVILKRTRYIQQLRSSQRKVSINQ